MTLPVGIHRSVRVWLYRNVLLGRPTVVKAVRVIHKYKLTNGTRISTMRVNPKIIRLKLEMQKILTPLVQMLLLICTRVTYTYLIFLLCTVYQSTSDVIVTYFAVESPGTYCSCLWRYNDCARCRCVTSVVKAYYYNIMFWNRQLEESAQVLFTHGVFFTCTSRAIKYGTFRPAVTVGENKLRAVGDDRRRWLSAAATTTTVCIL